MKKRRFLIHICFKELPKVCRFAPSPAWGEFRNLLKNISKFLRNLSGLRISISKSYGKTEEQKSGVWRNNNIFWQNHLFCQHKTSCVDKKDARNFSPVKTGEKLFFRQKIRVFIFKKLWGSPWKKFHEKRDENAIFSQKIREGGFEPSDLSRSYAKKSRSRQPKTNRLTTGGFFYRKNFRKIKILSE